MRMRGAVNATIEGDNELLDSLLSSRRAWMENFFQALASLEEWRIAARVHRRGCSDQTNCPVCAHLRAEEV